MGRPCDGTGGYGITVIAAGGTGIQAVNRLARAGLAGVTYVVMGRDPDAPDRAADWAAAGELEQELAPLLHATDMALIVAGLGDESVTAAACAAASIAGKHGIALTPALVTAPLPTEGKTRVSRARAGIGQLCSHADAVFAIPCAQLAHLTEDGDSPAEPYRLAGDVLCHGVRGLCELIGGRGLIDLDMADLRLVLRDAGPAFMGVGGGMGKDRVVQAFRNAIATPLTESRLPGARRMLMLISAAPEVTLTELAEALPPIMEGTFGPDVTCLFNVVFEDEKTNCWTRSGSRCSLRVLPPPAPVRTTRRTAWRRQWR